MDIRYVLSPATAHRDKWLKTEEKLLGLEKFVPLWPFELNMKAPTEKNIVRFHFIGS